MPKTTATRFIDHFTSRRIPQAADMLASNFVFKAPGFPEVRGAREWSTFISAIYADCPQLSIKMEEQSAEGNTVFTRYTWKTVHDHELHGGCPCHREESLAELGNLHRARGRPGKRSA